MFKGETKADFIITRCVAELGFDMEYLKDTNPDKLNNLVLRKINYIKHKEGRYVTIIQPTLSRTGPSKETVQFFIIRLADVAKRFDLSKHITIQMFVTRSPSDGYCEDGEFMGEQYKIRVTTLSIKQRVCNYLVQLQVKYNNL